MGGAVVSPLLGWPCQACRRGCLLRPALRSSQRPPSGSGDDCAAAGAPGPLPSAPSQSAAHQHLISLSLAQYMLILVLYGQCHDLLHIGLYSWRQHGPTPISIVHNLQMCDMAKTDQQKCDKTTHMDSKSVAAVQSAGRSPHPIRI